MERNRTRAIVVSVVAGTLTAAVLSWYANSIGYPMYELEHVSYPVPYLVFFVLGGLPVGLFVPSRVITPTLVFAAFIALWVGAEADPGPGDPLIGLVWFLGPAWIALMGITAGIEHRLRHGNWSM